MLKMRISSNKRQNCFHCRPNACFAPIAPILPGLEVGPGATLLGDPLNSAIGGRRGPIRHNPCLVLST